MQLDRRVAVDRKGDRHRPERAVGQAHLGDDALVVGAAEEAVERRKGASGKELEVALRAGRDPDRRQRGRVRDTLPGRDEEVDDAAP